MFKVNNRNTRKRCEVCSKSLTSFWCFNCELWTYCTTFSCVSIVDLEQVNVSWVFSVFSHKTVGGNMLAPWKLAINWFQTSVTFATPWKHHKTSDFLMLLGCNEMEYWRKINFSVSWSIFQTGVQLYDILISWISGHLDTT